MAVSAPAEAAQPSTGTHPRLVRFREGVRGERRSARAPDPPRRHRVEAVADNIAGAVGGFSFAADGDPCGMLTKTRLFVLALLVAAAASGCGAAGVTTTTNAQGKRVVACAGHVRFAKTKFVLHAGLAFGAFHRYILKPYEAGTFRKGAQGRTKALVKGGAAGAFAYHELKVARADAICDGPVLRTLAVSMTTAVAALSPLQGLKTGSGIGAIEGAAKAINGLGTRAAGGGAPIKDINH